VPTAQGVPVPAPSSVAVPSEAVPNAVKLSPLGTQSYVCTSCSGTGPVLPAVSRNPTGAPPVAGLPDVIFLTSVAAGCFTTTCALAVRGAGSVPSARSGSRPLSNVAVFVSVPDAAVPTHAVTVRVNSWSVVVVLS
jgi:hypothetical protein